MYSYDKARKRDGWPVRGTLTLVRRDTNRLVMGSLLALSLLLPAVGSAADDEEAGVIYQKKTIVNFDEDTIDGDLTRPDAAYVESRKRVRHSNLIKIREDFREKILRSVSSL